MGSTGTLEKPLNSIQLDYLKNCSKASLRRVELVLEAEEVVYFGMALSVPYHPYNCCLICGSSFAAEAKKKPTIEHCKGQEWIVEWWPLEGPLAEDYQEIQQTKKRKLLRCSGCKQAPYCSGNCQKLDWNVSYFRDRFIKSTRAKSKCFQEFKIALK